MTSNTDTKSNEAGETSNQSIQQQPPPYSGGSTAAKSSQKVNHEATEHTQLLSSSVVTSYTTPYLSTPNLTYDPANSNAVVVSPVVPLTALRAMPALTICPCCHRTVLSDVRFESGGCSWLSCWVLGFLGAGPFCFIPFFVNDLRDAIHYCPSCGKIMAKYCRFDGNVYKYIGPQ